ncbi:GAF and ANTAR domain-containing protein [Actinokineospora auranticolor]|uniref:GAF domain-containing protein n=1 Tax=Actinokineospora auranticolor TaxID=155976 RepID=A0A2S6GD06_9PSEU|nr:GAF and ANTAR domain-containing protein [Actinokineospora auranticolor]PPK63099.1 GAF domain-containing protein [Actinokineospora auranticolor]
MTDVLSLARELAEVTRLVEDDDVASAFERFTGRAVATVPGCVHASLAIRGPRGEVEAVGDDPRDVDLLVAGPITEALEYHEPRRLDDVRTDRRWPAFSACAALLGFRSCLSLPIPGRGGSGAVFTLYAEEPGTFDESSYDLVILLALHAGVVFDNVNLYHDSGKLVDQLRSALATRAAIGRAQGLLMRHFDYGADAAFDELRRASQHTNRKLREVAADLVDAQERGGFTEYLASPGFAGTPDRV